jgi:hypothetical protein
LRIAEWSALNLSAFAKIFQLARIHSKIGIAFQSVGSVSEENVDCARRGSFESNQDKNFSSD